MAKGVPAGLHTVTAALTIDGAAEAIDFYVRAFGAVVENRVADPSGKKIWHAQLRIGDSAIFVNDAFPEQGAPATRGGLWIYCEDVDAAFDRAVAAGAEPKMPPTDMFWGDRFGAVTDRWGQNWSLATRVKDLSPEEMKKAEAEAIKRWKETP